MKTSKSKPGENENHKNAKIFEIDFIGVSQGEVSPVFLQLFINDDVDHMSKIVPIFLKKFENLQLILKFWSKNSQNKIEMHDKRSIKYMIGIIKRFHSYLFLNRK